MLLRKYFVIPFILISCGILFYLGVYSNNYFGNLFYNNIKNIDTSNKNNNISNINTLNKNNISSINSPNNNITNIDTSNKNNNISNINTLNKNTLDINGTITNNNVPDIKNQAASTVNNSINVDKAELVTPVQNISSTTPTPSTRVIHSSNSDMPATSAQNLAPTIIALPPPPPASPVQIQLKMF